ncbi:phage Gp37/Gp68 family protein [Comamonas testosteroni]|uniref:phage Gp37/Gp68 family protein n=1 Tax=Comamonas testosteroni TaxID=285 RepID=UPI0026601E44|nr:phage Gp37/Gp68 family protein [Comamonas testosteroni]WKL16590.1 phage Gp37/Gp68 family protein [Comamonas testosteroni]
MAENTKIEWTDHTFNPWEGCQKVGPGCDHCYAETRNARYAGGQAINWGPGAPRRRTSASNWNKPLAWNANHEAFFAEHGRRQRVFCASLADVFDNQVPAEWRDDLATLILDTPNLDWLLLTKRIGNAGTMLGEMFLDGTPPNVRIGASIVNQPEADRDISKLLALGLPNFLSMEPLLGPVDLERACDLAEEQVCKGTWKEMADPLKCAAALRRGSVALLDWVIVGGESGPGARPMHPDWARALRDQCQAAGVPFLFKQWGEWAPAQLERSPSGDKLVIKGAAPFTDKPEWHTFADGQEMARIGKKAAGRLLDGRTWDEFPQT